MPPNKRKRPGFINKPFKAILDFTCQPDDRDQINKQSEEYAPNSQPDEEIVAEEYSLEKKILKTGSLTSVTVAFDNTVPYSWIRGQDAEKVEQIKMSAIRGETTPDSSIYKGLISNGTSKVLVYDGIQRIHAFKSLPDFTEKWGPYQVLIVANEIEKEDFEAILAGLQLGKIIRPSNVSALILGALKEISLQSKYKEEHILWSVRNAVESCFTCKDLNKLFKTKQGELVHFLKQNFAQYFGSKNSATDASCAILLPDKILELALDLESKRRTYSREIDVNFARFSGKEMFRTLKARCKPNTLAKLEKYLMSLVNGGHEAYSSTDDLVTSIKNTVPTRISVTNNSSTNSPVFTAAFDNVPEKHILENEMASVENENSHSDSTISEDLNLGNKRQRTRFQTATPVEEPIEEGSIFSESEGQIKRPRGRSPEDVEIDAQNEAESHSQNRSHFPRKRVLTVKPLPKKSFGLEQMFKKDPTQKSFAQKIERALIERQNKDLWILLEANEGRRDVKELAPIMDFVCKQEHKILLSLYGIDSIIAYSTSANFAAYSIGNAYYNEENNNEHKIGQLLVIGDRIEFGDIAQKIGKDKLYKSTKEMKEALKKLLIGKEGEVMLQKLHD